MGFPIKIFEQEKRITLTVDEIVDDLKSLVLKQGFFIGYDRTEDTREGSRLTFFTKKMGDDHLVLKISWGKKIIKSSNPRWVDDKGQKVKPKNNSFVNIYFTLTQAGNLSKELIGQGFKNKKTNPFSYDFATVKMGEKLSVYEGIKSELVTQLNWFENHFDIQPEVINQPKVQPEIEPKDNRIDYVPPVEPTVQDEVKDLMDRLKKVL